MLLKHKHLIFNWFKADGRLSSGTVEGLNLKAKLPMRKLMVVNHWIACKQPCIIPLVIYRNLYLPTDSADEAKFVNSLVA